MIHLLQFRRWNKLAFHISPCIFKLVCVVFTSLRWYLNQTQAVLEVLQKCYYIRPSKIAMMTLTEQLLESKHETNLNFQHIYII